MQHGCRRMITVDINFDADFEETKHPRAKGGSHGGQFVKKGAGGGERVEKGVPLHSTPYVPMKAIHQAATGSGSPQEKAAKIKEVASNYKPANVASYANKALKALESAHSLKPGSLGKAAPKGEAATPAQAEPSKSAKAKPAVTYGEKPELPPDAGMFAKKVHNIGQNPLMSVPDKVTELKHVMEVMPQPTAPPHKLAKAWIKHLTGEDYDTPNKPMNTPSTFSTPPPPSSESQSTYGPKTTLPTNAGTYTKQVEYIAEHPVMPSAKKVEMLKEGMQESPPGSMSYKYAQEWIKHLSGESYEAPAKPPPSETPDPTPLPASSPTQPSSLSITAPPNSPRLKRALEEFAKAHKPASASSAKMREVVPSLKPQVWNNAPTEAVHSCKYYSGSGYQGINKALRNPDEAHQNYIQHIDHIDEMFERQEAKVTEPVVLRRGENVPAEHIAKWEAALKKGLPVRFAKDGFISASAAPDEAFHTKSASFEITVKAGTPALGLAAVSSHKHENEILLRHGQAFEIYAIERASPNAKPVIRMISV
jgi:hypothetical protein